MYIYFKGKAVMKVIDITTNTKDLSSVLLSSKAGADDRRLVVNLSDLLEKLLILDPSKRFTVSDALKHIFFTTK
jgi:serine/threonine-protein kinase PRP4